MAIRYASQKTAIAAEGQAQRPQAPAAAFGGLQSAEIGERARALPGRLARRLLRRIIPMLLAAALPLAWWACTMTARHLRTPDPSAIVIDEVVAFWLVLWLLLPAGFWAQAVAFALFRFFDAIKPGPVGWADRLLHGRGGWAGGFGILLDDLVAAFCTLLVIALWRAG